MKTFFSKILGKPEFLLFLLIVAIFILIIQTLCIFKMLKNKRKLRKDAVKRSKAVIGGQLAEQIAPFLPNFPANPADARFIGKPVDFIAFSGLCESGKIDEILLIEVKTGKSALSDREKEVKKAAQDGRVRYVEYKIKI